VPGLFLSGAAIVDRRAPDIRVGSAAASALLCPRSAIDSDQSPREVHPVNAIFKFFRSVKLAVALLAFLTLFALLSTLVQQGKDPGFYAEVYGPFLAGVIQITTLDRFTSSLLFIIPMVLFVINLSVCTVDRLVSRARRKAKKHFGPDLIHISLLLLTVGAMTTTLVRREQDFWMAKGDVMNLPGGYTMKLSGFEYLQYPNGRPKEWTSTVDLMKGDLVVRKDYKIEVNRPLSVGLLKVYQMNYSQGAIRLVDGAGVLRNLCIGQDLMLAESNYRFAELRMAADGKGIAAHLLQWWDGKMIAERDVAAGDQVDNYIVMSVSDEGVTGLRAAVDPGFITVLIALIIMMAGLTLTSIHKSKGVD
jgi:cytochrome c biogenesis protein ResB